MHSLKLTRWAVPAFFVIAAASAGSRAAADASHALSHPTTRAWLIAVYGLLRGGIALAFALFTVGRAVPHRPSRSPIAFLSCTAAMAAVLAFAEPGRGTPEALLLAGELVAVAFCFWLLLSVLSLGRCFGVLPEARGLVTCGPYRLVRHPVYLGEIGACAGLALAAPSIWNLGAVSVLVVAQVMRMHLEERALTLAFPQYIEYATRTPRLLPRLDRLVKARDGSTRARVRWQRPERLTTVAEQHGEG